MSKDIRVMSCMFRDVFMCTESDRIGLPADIYLDDRMSVCCLGRGTVFASVSGVVLEMLEISSALYEYKRFY